MLSLGMDQRLQVSSATLDFLAARSVNIEIAETRQAVRIYTKLAEDSRPAASSIQLADIGGVQWLQVLADRIDRRGY